MSTAEWAARAEPRSRHRFWRAQLHRGSAETHDVVTALCPHRHRQQQTALLCAQLALSRLDAAAATRADALHALRLSAVT